jgi:hypothetical protein
MRVRLAQIAGICLAVILGSALMSSVFAQDKAQKGDKSAKAAPPQKMSNIQGKVGKVEKDSIVVMIGTNPKPVMFSSATKFLFGHSNDNKPGTLADVKQGYFIACAGGVDDKGQFMAKECVYRDKQ